MFIENTKPLADKFLNDKVQRNQVSEADSFKHQLKRWMNFVSENNPWVEFVGELERKDIENYLVYLRNVDYKSSGFIQYRNSFIYRNLRAVNKFFEYLTIYSEMLPVECIPKPDLIYRVDFPNPNQRGIKHFPTWLDSLILKEIRSLPEEDIKQLRFKTIMIFIYHTGARIKDVCTLEKDCFAEKLGFNWVRIFSNKTKSYYEIPIHTEAFKYLSLYRNVAKTVKCIHPTTKQVAEFIFVQRGTPDGSKCLIRKKIKQFGFEVRKKAEEQGFPVEDIEELSLTSHKYRHNVGIKLIRMGADPMLVAEYLGHSNLSMAQAYIQEDEQEIESVMNELRSDDSLEINAKGELIDSIVITKQNVLEHFGVVSKVEGGWCTHLPDKPPCGDGAYDCWKCDNLRPDFDDKRYIEKLIRLLEDHEILRERNIRKGLLGAAKAEELVILRIQSFIKEVKRHAGEE